MWRGYVGTVRADRAPKFPWNELPACQLRHASEGLLAAAVYAVAAPQDPVPEAKLLQKFDQPAVRPPASPFASKAADGYTGTTSILRSMKSNETRPRPQTRSV